MQDSMQDSMQDVLPPNDLTLRRLARGEIERVWTIDRGEIIE